MSAHFDKDKTEFQSFAIFGSMKQIQCAVSASQEHREEEKAN